MITKFFLFSIVLFFTQMLSGGWYIWQRQWTEAVTQAADAVAAEELFILRAELEITNNEWQWQRISIPEKYQTSTAVLRVPAKALHNPEKLINELYHENTSLKTKKIQFDIDVPESQLKHYAQILSLLKMRLPGYELSITLLPCHLNCQESKTVIQAVDWWVLQLHGITVPTHRKEKYQLMDRTVVATALKKARTTQSQFKIALPTYAYVLSFHADGTFRRLYSEGFSGNGDTSNLELAAPDLQFIASIIRANPDIDLLWFRLPVKNDRWTLSTDTLTLLSQGITPKEKLEQHNKIEGNTLRISFRWCHQIPLHGKTATLQIPPEWREGECILLNSVALPGYIYGTIPETIQVPPARCGEEIPVAIITLRKPKS